MIGEEDFVVVEEFGYFVVGVEFDVVGVVGF